MKPRLVLSLSGARLLLEAVGQSAVGGLPGLLRSLPFVGAGPSYDAVQAVVRVALPTVTRHDALRPVLDQAMAELTATFGKVGGRDLEVQLGLDHARIGLMVLEDMAATALSSSTLEAYAHAWVRQMFHVESETQVIRWQVLEDPRKLLIACVDRSVFDALCAFSGQHHLRFVSCRPAVLSAARRGQPIAQAELTEPRSLTVVWTEAGTDGPRSSRVQLLHFEGARLTSAWRGWAPAPADAGDTDDALDGAIRRFQGYALAEAGAALKRVHWPVDLQDASLAR